MSKRIVKLAAMALLIAATATTMGAKPVSAAGKIGPITTAGTAECWGAYWTPGGKFVKVTAPVVLAYNQHARTVDRQRVRFNAVLLRWDGKAWQYAYTPAGARIQTGWISRVVHDGTDTSFQISGDHMGYLNVVRQGYYAVMFDIRWDASGTVTVSGSADLWAVHYNNNGESSLFNPNANYCDYVQRAVWV